MTTDEEYRWLAKELYESDGEIEIDDNAVVSRGCDPGAYVQAWVWVWDPNKEPEEYCGEPPITNAERLESGEVKPR